MRNKRSRGRKSAGKKATGSVQGEKKRGGGTERAAGRDRGRSNRGKRGERGAKGEGDGGEDREALRRERGRGDGEARKSGEEEAPEAAMAGLEGAIQTDGGNGMTREPEKLRLWDLARVLRIAPVSREMILK